MERLRTPDWLAGLAGLVLLLSLWTPWYEVVDGSINGWQALSFIDIWLVISALLGMGIVVVTATRDAPALPVAFDVLTVWASLLAIPMVLYRVISVAYSEVVDARGWGLFLAVAAVLGLFASAWWAMRDQRQPGQRPHPEVRAMPVPPERDPAMPPT